MPSHAESVTAARTVAMTVAMVVVMWCGLRIMTVSFVVEVRPVTIQAACHAADPAAAPRRARLPDPVDRSAQPISAMCSWPARGATIA
jgi:hypothetical protein